MVKTGPKEIDARWLPGNTVNFVTVGDAYIYRMAL
jgi:ribosomal protein S2